MRLSLSLSVPLWAAHCRKHVCVHVCKLFSFRGGYGFHAIESIMAHRMAHFNDNTSPCLLLLNGTEILILILCDGNLYLSDNFF